MRIQNNITAQNSHRQYGINQNSIAKNFEKLSSGFKINRAADDAAGLAISEKMRTQIRGLTQAGRNVQDGISLLQVADGAMQIAHGIIQRMRELAAQSANGTNEELDREALDLEYQQLMSELNQIADTTNFNNVYMLKGSGMDLPIDTVIKGTDPLTGGVSVSGTYAGPVINLTYADINGPTITGANSLWGLNPAPVGDNPGLSPLTPPIPGISSGTYTIPSGTTKVNAADLAGVTAIDLSSGGTLIIEGTLPNSVTFTGNGSARINAAVTGNVTVNSGSSVLIAGNVSGNVTNFGNMEIAGSSSGTITNNNNMLISGNNVSGIINNGRMRINGTNVTVAVNNYHLCSETPMTLTRNEGQAYLETGGTIGTNNGDACVTGASCNIGLNTGRIDIGAATAIIEDNNGHIRTISGNIKTIITKNSGDGRVYIGSNDPEIYNNYGLLIIDADRMFVETNHPSGQISLASAGGIPSSPEITNNMGKAILGLPGGVTDEAKVGENSGDLKILGSDAIVGKNNGNIFIDGTNAKIEQNLEDGYARINGADAKIDYNFFGAGAYINGANAIIGENSGNLQVNGNGTTVNHNSASGAIRFESDTNAKIQDNNGILEVASGSIITELKNYATGKVLIESGGRVSDAAAVNRGRIDVDAGGTLSIAENAATGIIISRGTSSFGINRGYLEAGTWSGDDATPFDGSVNGTVNISGSNTGNIRNFSANLTVAANTGQIDNYGKLLSLPGGTVYHHARQVDASGLSANGGTVLKYYANGNLIADDAGGWTTSAEFGSQLIFGEKTIDGGVVIHDASPKYDVKDTDYSVTDRVSVINGRGSSGRTLMFVVYEDFVIQSGANEGDITFLNFRGLYANNLGRNAETSVAGMESLGLSNIKTMENAACSLTITANAINDISLYRAELGAQYNRLEFTYGNIGVNVENQGASESRIRDTDMAKEMTIMTKNNILIQSSTAMLAQANTQPQGVLQLLG